jgi:hypothetical protein
VNWDKIYPLLWVGLYVAAFIVVPMAVSLRDRRKHGRFW